MVRETLDEVLELCSIDYQPCLVNVPENVIKMV